MLAHDIFEKCMKLKESAPTIMFSQLNKKLTYLTIRLLPLFFTLRRKNYAKTWIRLVSRASISRKGGHFLNNCLRSYKAGLNSVEHISQNQRHL